MGGDEGEGAEGSAFSNILHRHSGIEAAGNNRSLGIISDNGDSRSYNDNSFPVNSGMEKKHNRLCISS